MQTQSKNRKVSNSSAVIKGSVPSRQQPPSGPNRVVNGFRPSSRFQSINRGRR